MQLPPLGFGPTILLVLALTSCSGSDSSSAVVEASGGTRTATNTDSSAEHPTALRGGSDYGSATATAAGTAPGANTGVAFGGTSSQRGNPATGSTNGTTGGTSSRVGAVTTGGTNPTSDMTIGTGNVATGGKSGATGGNAVAAGSASAATDCPKEGDNKTTLEFVNYCTQTVTYRGSDIAGGTVAPGASVCVDVGNATDAISSKRYWGYIGADPGAEHHSLAEFTFNTDFYDMDWYNISYVDAFNLPLAILPLVRPKCRQLVCPQDFLGACPAEGQYRDIGGRVVSCVSPNRDDPNGPVVQLFEQCNDAYAWSGDDQTGSDPSPMIGCEVEDFDIVFCPKG